MNTPQDAHRDEARLHAYVDGQLKPEDMRQVAAWLQQHPDDAARVLAWQEQRTALRALRADLLDAPVPAALTDALRRPAPRWPYALAAGVLLAIGVGIGWTARPLAGDALRTLAGTPAFVHDATVAHVAYTPERRHPVEVGADQRDHLVQWLSKRLGAPLRAPLLSEQGWSLVGGRLLPGGTDAKAGPAPRAQFMYENSAGERVTLYVSVFPEGQMAPTAFRFASEGTTNSFYWIDGRQGYALTGPLPKPALSALADVVYKQLTP